jgi:hypothetical protein
MMKWSSISGILGGLLWICAGTVLALRPGNVPGVSFRASMDVLPWLGFGLLVVAVMLNSLNYQQRDEAGKLGKWTALIAIVSAALYLFGHLVRQFLKGAWEPAVPVGFLIFIFSLFVLAIATLRARVYPKRVAIALLFAACSLLVFNDQFVTAWSAVPFGLTCIVLAIMMDSFGRDSKRLSNLKS